MVNSEVKEEMKIRDRNREVARYSQRMDDWQKYRRSRNTCVKLLEKSKNELYKKLYSKIDSEQDTKNLYRLTHEIIGKKATNTPQQLVVQGSLLRKPVEIANALADYYDSKVKLITQKLPELTRNPHRFLDAALESWEGKSALPTFLFKELSLIEVSKLISTLSNSTAMGHDRLDARGIKDAAVHLVKLIRHIVNTSLRNGKFAKKWKFARITPLLKNNELSKSLVSSYRPVAVLTTLSKLTERAAQQQLLMHLETNKLMNPSCHAYRKMLSTTMTISEILDEIHEGAEEGKIIQMMTLDQTAAFDTVNHKLLIEKLSRYGV